MYARALGSLQWPTQDQLQSLLDQRRQRYATPRRFLPRAVEQRVVEPNRCSHMSKHTHMYVDMSNLCRMGPAQLSRELRTCSIS